MAENESDDPAIDATESPAKALADERGAAISLAALPRGNPLRWKRGGITALISGFLAVWLMCSDAHTPGGVPFGAFFVLISTLGVLDFLGTFDDDETRVATRVVIADLRAPIAAVLVGFAGTWAILAACVQGLLPIWASALLVSASAIGLVVAVFRLGVQLGPWAHDEAGLPRDLLHRHGFWVVAVALLLYLPMAGNHSLTDPWETHYGEVSRELLSRDDWISTWWAHEGWFFSKPVLNFWLQALAMASLGVAYKPDQMLALTSWGTIPRPEWAVRLPVVLLAVLALYILYKGVAKVFGRRAGLLGALALMTMPQWSLLTHQTMADMPFVAALASAMGLFLYGIHTASDQRTKLYEVRIGKQVLRLGAHHLVFGLILVSALPQAFYLVSRNLEWVSAKHAFRTPPVLDFFSAGSKGNCGVIPGDEACVVHRPTITWLQPAYQGAFWLALTGGFLALSWGERRIRRLCFHAAYFFAAVATLGKGPAGILLPVLCVLAYVVVTGKWRELTEVEVLSGILIVLFVSMPWYVAMYVRHGPAFLDRLIFHDMWKRALTHVHDTNEGDDVSFRFYVWQLGYALFPLVALVPASLVWWARKPDESDEGRGDASVFLVMWFVFAFALFSAMLTKFHHYIFPAVPAAGMLTGVLLDRLLGTRRLIETTDRKLPSVTHMLLLGAGTLLFTYGVMRLFPGALDGYRGDAGALAPRSLPIGIVAICAGAGAAFVGFRRLESISGELPVPDDRTRFEDALLGASMIAGAAVVCLVGRDLFAHPDGDIVGDARLLHLFTYNYKRPWPDALDFSAVLAATTITAVVLSVSMSIRRVRSAAVVMTLGLALGFAVWCLDVYFVQVAPHWGQRETIEAYYRLRKDPSEPLVAYQMNWKGENFYTGNHVAKFVTTGEKFKQWIKEQRERGTHIFYFTLEHSRINGLKGELGNPTDVEVLSDRRIDNKFTLVRVRFPD